MMDDAALGALRIGVMTGSDANRQVIDDPTAFTHGRGNNDGLRMLRMLEPTVALTRLHLTPNYFRQTKRWDLSRVRLLWNLISDVDLNPRTMEVAAELAAKAGVPVVNPPERMAATRRHAIAHTLSGIDGVVMPKTLLLRLPSEHRVRRQVEEAGFRFPAILRRAGSHNGEVVGLVDGVEAMAACFGDRRNTYYLTEFVDVRHPDGLYRKTRFFLVGEAIVLRQHIVSNQWAIHGHSSRAFMVERADLLEEGREKLVGGFDALPAGTRAALGEIRRRAQLDYGGLDCSLTPEGEVVVFECNATMNFRPTFGNPATQYNRAALPRMIDAMRRLIEAKAAAAPAG